MSKESDRIRYENNKIAIKAKQKAYRDANKRIYTNEQKINKSLYRKVNKKRINEYHKTYNKNKRANNPIFKLSALIRTSIGEAFRLNGFSNKTKTYIILGCSFDEFKLHLESKFEPWMNWDNHGLYNGIEQFGWDIDHIIPLSSATCEADIIRLNHYSNLQPLCSYINRYVKKDLF